MENSKIKEIISILFSSFPKKCGKGQKIPQKESKFHNSEKQNSSYTKKYLGFPRFPQALLLLVSFYKKNKFIEEKKTMLQNSSESVG